MTIGTASTGVVRALSVTDRRLLDAALGYPLAGTALSYFCADGTEFLAPFVTDRGIVVFRLAYADGAWRFVSCGEPFVTCTAGSWLYAVGESEPSLVREADRWLAYTRGSDRRGRLYESEDALHFRLIHERPNPSVPQALNVGLDGSIYLTTNTGPGMLRNPLLAYPWTGEAFSEPLVVHDQDGVRNDQGPSVPFVDHAVGTNLTLEGRRRHLLCYRACELHERTFHRHQASLAKEFRGQEPPSGRAGFGGLYVAEIEF